MYTVYTRCYQKLTFMTFGRTLLQRTGYLLHRLCRSHSEIVSAWCSIKSNNGWLHNINKFLFGNLLFEATSASLGVAHVQVAHIARKSDLPSQRSLGPSPQYALTPISSCWTCGHPILVSLLMETAIRQWYGFRSQSPCLSPVHQSPVHKQWKDWCRSEWWLTCTCTGPLTLYHKNSFKNQTLQRAFTRSQCNGGLFHVKDHQRLHASTSPQCL